MAALEEFRTRVRRPADFDRFWDDLLEESRRLPLDAEVESDALRSTPEVEVFQVRYDSLDGVRVFGWFCRPRGEERLPAIVLMPGYISEPKIGKPLAGQGFAVFSAAPRGKRRSHLQYNPGYPGLLTDNIVDRNTYAYRGFYADAWRAIDFLLERDEVDPARIGVTGSSQGGGLTVMAAALRPEVRAAAAGAPYLCGMIDAIALTTAYPYQEINDYLRLYPERREAVEETLAYFDAINFAPRVRCPIRVNLGLRDNVCPPETGYALFDALGSRDKRLCPYPDCGHDAGGGRHAAAVSEFFSKILRA